MPRKFASAPLGCLFLVLIIGCGHPHSPAALFATHLSPSESKIVEGARDQLTWGTQYDNRYFKISYPNGDLPRTKGACTDVVIRSYRHAGIDLQKLIHADITKNWSAYPRYGSLTHPDTSIDHRRVPNQRTFFRRHGAALTNEATKPGDWKPGDVVEWKVFGSDHTGVLTDRLDRDGFPYVIHNNGAGPQEEDVLRVKNWEIAGHFRYPPQKIHRGFTQQVR